MIQTKRSKRFVAAVGQNIRASRKSLGLSQTALSKKLKTDTPTVSRIENGRKDLRLSELHGVACVLGTTPVALVTVHDTHGEPSDSGCRSVL